MYVKFISSGLLSVYVVHQVVVAALFVCYENILPVECWLLTKIVCGQQQVLLRSDEGSLFGHVTFNKPKARRNST